jgi:HAD superfamily hydrolase (TIGR01662 family)
VESVETPSASVRRFDIVIPTVGRPSLSRLLEALEPQLAGNRVRVYVVDDRRRPSAPLSLPAFATAVRGAGAGPAAARNVGWRAADAEWIAFLDDDVIPAVDWVERLEADLDDLPAGVAASQGRLRVPLPSGPPTDWQRDVAGLEGALWITADMAFRRDALAAVGGFDERFAAAYREDTDLALRLLGAGWQIVRGKRASSHPIPPAGFWVSVSRQRGNADDVLMRALHGRHWRRWAGAGRGRRRRHLLTAGALAGASTAVVAGRRRTAVTLAAAWLGASAELAVARIAPGPRTAGEVTRMAATSAVLPLAASAWWALGVARLPRLLLARGPRMSAEPGPARLAPRAVLLDRDDTLLVDVPYNGDPKMAVPMPGARRALSRLRAAGLPLAVISNQSGIARGLIDAEQVRAVNRAAERLLGPIDEWIFCPHRPGDGCECRKPAPGMVLEAASRLRVGPQDCVVIGDIAADVQAAQAAGAAAILVPTERTRADDVRRAPRLAATIEAAVDLLLGPEAQDRLHDGKGVAAPAHPRVEIAA